MDLVVVHRSCTLTICINKIDNYQMNCTIENFISTQFRDNILKQNWLIHIRMVICHANIKTYRDI